MTEPYTPTTNQVRASFVNYVIDQGIELPNAKDAFNRWLAATLATVTPNPDDAEQHETAYWAILNALPLPWVAGSTIGAPKVAANLARAVLAALAESPKAEQSGEAS